METAHEREVTEAVGLAAYLIHERDGLAACGRQEHAHPGLEALHGFGERALRERAAHGASVDMARAYIYSARDRMSAMNALPALVVLLVTVVLAGCSSSPQRVETPTSVRCLSDAGPGAKGTVTDRPLVFLFCAQSP